MSRLTYGRGLSAGKTFLLATNTLLSLLSFSSVTPTTVNAQSKGPGPRAGHCVVEHNNVVYVLGGTPPVSSSYAEFTSLKLPVSSITPDSSESLPWQDLAPPPEPIQITNLTMTFSSLNPIATPNWSDCFATDDGKIVVVGGGFQLMSFDIGSNTWTDGPSIVPQVQYGPSVAPGMFLNPVYVQARILADGYTAIVVCTLNWNSQPQPYYLDTRSWEVTWAIGTASTTPVGSTSAASGWGTVPGVTTTLPPAGFRHFTLAVLGQDKKDKDHYGNGRAYMIGGYSTLVTGSVQDWDAITSFPVQQAPSNIVVMFGNSGSLSNTTRGSVAYPVSKSEMDILPGNGGGSSTVQNVETYFSGQTTASSMLTTITPGTGPRNTIFRGGVEIGQGSQIFVQGGITSLDIPSTASLTQYLDQSVAVWDGSNHQWSTTLNIYVPPKSKALPIGLGAGAAVLVLLIGLGFWIWKRKQRQRFLEEEERRVKGMAIKNEDMLQKEHKKTGGGGDQALPAEGSQRGSSGRFSPGVLAYRDPVYEPLQPPGTTGYSEGYSSERGSFSYQAPELVDDHEALSAGAVAARAGGHSSQQYPMTHLNTSSGNASGYAPGQASYQSVVSAAGHPVYGLSNESVTPAVVAMGVSSPTLIPIGFEGSQEQFRGPDQFRISLDSRTSLPGTRPTSTFTQQSSPYFTFYNSGTSPAAVYQQQQLQQHYQQQQQQTMHHQASPTFSNTYSLPNSSSGATHVSGGHPSGLSPALSNKDQNSEGYTAPPSMAYQTRPQP